MASSDKIHFEEFRKGNENAYEKIFQKYYPPLCSFALQYLPEKETCEDIVQEVMIAIWEKKTIFKNVDAFKTYLYTSVKNKALNVIKHQKVKTRHEDEIKFLDSEEFFTDKIIEEEVHAILFECYKALPEQCHRVFKLSYLEGLRLKEVAEKLNISVNTVKTQKYRAIKLIKERFEKLSKCLTQFPFLFP